MELAFVVSAFVAIFSVINPITKVIFFPMLTDGFTKQEKKEVASLAVNFSFLVFLAFGLFGIYLFRALNVELGTLRIVGGIVIAKIGFDMLQGQIPRTKQAPGELESLADKKEIGIFPLAIPFISGPGAIITVLTFTSTAPDVPELILVLVSVLVVCIITLIMMLYSEGVFKRLGKVGVFAVMRIMGMILLAIGVQMILDSAEDILSGWGAI
jgi:multiple antibiotic resistance protein